MVLPLLLADLVKQDCSVSPCVDDPQRSWLTTEQFYAGLGIVQAAPGPLFNFAAYLVRAPPRRIGAVHVMYGVSPVALWPLNSRDGS